MNEILITLMALFVFAEAPEHPWMAEAWAEVDRIGSFESCTAEGIEPEGGIEPETGGYYQHTMWTRGGEVVRTENVICMRLPESAEDVHWFWFTVAHELAHVYDLEVLADRERRVWDRRLNGCHQPDEVMADVFAYSVVTLPRGWDIGLYYTREYRAGRCDEPLWEQPSQSMVDFVGRAARGRWEAEGLPQVHHPLGDWVLETLWRQ